MDVEASCRGCGGGQRSASELRCTAGRGERGSLSCLRAGSVSLARCGCDVGKALSPRALCGQRWGGETDERAVERRVGAGNEVGNMVGGKTEGVERAESDDVFKPHPRQEQPTLDSPELSAGK